MQSLGSISFPDNSRRFKRIIDNIKSKIIHQSIILASVAYNDSNTSLNKIKVDLIKKITSLKNNEDTITFESINSIVIRRFFIKIQLPKFERISSRTI